MKWKLFLQALIFMVIGGIIAETASYFTQKAQQEVLIEAVNKQTTAIQNTFEKIKTNKGYIDLDLDNKSQTNINDSIKKKKFWFFKK